MKIIRGDITQSNADYIVQQCNCLTVSSHGLSKTLEDKFSHGILYSKRRAMGSRNLAIPEDRAKPGTTVILFGKPNIVCIFGQWRPGTLGTPYWYSYPESNPVETTQQRLSWFVSSLWSFGTYIRQTIKRKVTVAIPYNIGCGLAGGKWDQYFETIKLFNVEFQDVLDITIHRL